MAAANSEPRKNSRAGAFGVAHLVLVRLYPERTLMTTPDLLYLLLLAILLLLDYFVLWPAFLRWSHVDQGRARLWLWSGWMIMLWSLVAAGVALWLFEARTWESLRLVAPRGWRLWGAEALVLMVIIIYA